MSTIANITTDTGRVEYTSFYPASDAATTNVHAYVHIETRAERYARVSNFAADRACDWGIQGDDELSSLYAQQADVWADLAAAVRFIELGLERLP